MLNKALINVEETHVRVAVLEDDTLVDIFIEDVQSRTKVGNVYKGRVEGIVPGLKALFIDIGAPKNAFLHFRDVLPEYELPTSGKPERARGGARRAGQAAPEADRVIADVDDEDDYIDPILAERAEVESDTDDATNDQRRKKPKPKKRPIKVGDELLVQVTKDEINDKGPRVTAFVSLPGRFMVYMPLADEGGGVSRKIEDGRERRRLRDILRACECGQGSVIIRTAGVGQDEALIRQDLEMLSKRWQGIVRRTGRCRAPACVHNDQDILPRLVRDRFSAVLDEILIDDKTAMRSLIEACQDTAPELADLIHYYDSPINIFDTFDVERQFQKALQRRVWMKSGGAIIIDETEALTAIDVNSGKYVGKGNQDEVILKTNLEACVTVARQLRLRDLGGLVVVDFIDMRSREDEKKVLQEFKRCLAKDGARCRISDFSDFGLLEMTRKRVRGSLAKAQLRSCPYCEGSGRILTEAQVWKRLKYDLIKRLEKTPDCTAIELLIHSEIKTYLMEHAIEALQNLAGQYGVALNIRTEDSMHREQYEIAIKKKSTLKKKPASRRVAATRPRAVPEKA